MKKYIAIYGGTNLDDQQREFVSLLARAILQHPQTVIVTGGFERLRDQPHTQSTDRAAADGALSFLRAQGLPLTERLETWLPEPSKDPRQKEVIRFAEGCIKRLKDQTPMARRFFIVNGADAIVTVKGQDQTQVVLELAFTLGKPALPLPFTGGDSATQWLANKAAIVKRFGLTEEFVRQLESTVLDDLSPEEMRSLAEQIAHQLGNVVRKRCLILMDFDEEPDRFYDQYVEPAVNKAGFEPIRIDREVVPGHIRGLFLQLLNECETVLADVTEVNPNVMYELGCAHARGIEPLLFSRRMFSEGQVPFYLREYKLEAYNTADALTRAQLITRIETYLKERS